MLNYGVSTPNSKDPFIFYNACGRNSVLIDSMRRPPYFKTNKQERQCHNDPKADQYQEGDRFLGIDKNGQTNACKRAKHCSSNYKKYHRCF